MGIAIPEILEIQLLKYLTLKIDVKNYDQNQNWWLKLRPSVQLRHSFFILWQLDHFCSRHSKFHIWAWKLKIKIQANFNPNCGIWDLEFNWHFCLFFRGNQTILEWDIANSIFGTKNSRPRPWPCFLLVLWQSDHFWLRYGKFHIWLW